MQASDHSNSRERRSSRLRSSRHLRARRAPVHGTLRPLTQASHAPLSPSRHRALAHTAPIRHDRRPCAKSPPPLPPSATAAASSINAHSSLRAKFELARARSPRSPRPPLHRADRKNDLRALRDLLPRAPLVGRRAAGRHAQDGEAPAAHGAEVQQGERLRDRAEVGRRRLELAVDPQGGRGQGLLPRQLVGPDALPRRGDVREELRARGRRRGVREHVRDQGVGRRAQARLRHAGAPQFVGAKFLGAILRRARATLALTLAFVSRRVPTQRTSARARTCSTTTRRTSSSS